MSNLTFVNQVGAPDGINQAGPGTFIPETFVRWAQDVLFDRAGLLRRRAPFKNFVYGTFTQPSTNNERAVSFVSTLNPAGDRILGLVLTTGSGSRIKYYNSVYADNISGTEVSSDLGFTLPQDCIFDCKQANNGGMWLSFMESYVPGEGANEYYQYYWYGGAGVEQTISSVTLGYTSGGSNTDRTHSTYTNVISGTIPATVTPGMFVYITYNDGGGNKDYYAGTIKSVTSGAGGNITLTKDIIRFAKLSAGTYIDNTAALNTVSIKVKNIRPYIHTHGRGLITRATTTTTTITSGSVGTEGEGHFQSAFIDSTYAIYNASDGQWIGDVSATAGDNTSLTLDSAYHGTQSNTTMRGDEYLAIKYASVPSAKISDRTANDVAGVFNATYTGYQWYGNAGDTINSNRVVFSAYHDAEAVDLSPDSADSIIIPGTTELRGMASSSSGLIVFTADKTYIIRGNYRSNFSLELLYPEGCLSSMSIVEYGGGVFWTSKLGIMYYDGASVRNLTESNLGVYYTDSVKSFSSNSDRVYAFLHKDYLFVNFTTFDSVYKPLRYEPIYAEGITSTEAISGFAANDWDPDFTADDFNAANNVPIYWDPITLYTSTGADAIGQQFLWGDGTTNQKWQSGANQYVWGPIDVTEGITFAIYVPTNAVTIISNFDQHGAVKIDSNTGLKSLMAANVVVGSNVQARIIDVDSILNIDNIYDSAVDEELIENSGKAATNYIKGPDFYLQTKHYSVGDPILKKWFRQVFLNLYLIDGAVRMDVVDNEDNDRIDIEKKIHKNWEVFEEAGYSWRDMEEFILPRRLSPNRSTWNNLSNLSISWYNLADSAFERRKKRTSWRYPTFGIRLYQMNNYRPRNYQTSQRPHTLMLDAWNIGFKPMRQSRV